MTSRHVTSKKTETGDKSTITLTTTSSIPANTSITAILYEDVGDNLFWDNFADGDVLEWTVNDFSVTSNNSYIGENSAKCDNAQSNTYQARRELSSAKTPSKMEFFWEEQESGSFGGGLRVLNSNDNVEVGMATDNPDWILDDNSGINTVQSRSGTYFRWIRVEFTFDWGNGTYDVTIEDLVDGTTYTDTGRNLKNGSDLKAVQIEDYNSGSWQDGNTIGMWFDSIRLWDNDASTTLSGGTDETNDLSGFDGGGSTNAYRVELILDGDGSDPTLDSPTVSKISADVSVPSETLFATSTSSPSITETLQVSETSSATSTSSASITAKVGVSETLAATATSTGTVNSLTEALETLSSTSTSAASITDVLQVSEALSADSTSTASLLETAQIVEVISANSTSSASLSETLNVVESLSASSDSTASITDLLQVVDSLSASITSTASIVHQVLRSGSGLGRGELGDGRLGDDIKLRRGFTDAEINQLNSMDVRPAIFIEIEFWNGTKRYWSGVRDITVDGSGLGSGSLGTDTLGGKDFSGGDGAFLDISTITETVDLESNGVTISLSGIDQQLKDIAQNSDHYRDAPVEVLIGFRDKDGNLLEEPPTTLWRGYVNEMPLTVDPDGPVIEVKAESPLSVQRRANPRYWTHEDQQQDFPDDDFFKNRGAVREQSINLYGSTVNTEGGNRQLSGRDKPKKEDLPRMTSHLREKGKINLGTPKRGQEARNIVYGEARVENPITYAGVGSDQLHLVMPVADHSIEEVQEIILSGETIYNNGAVTNQYQGKIDVSVHLGDKDQNADARLVNNAPGYTDSMRGRGVAYVAISMDLTLGIFKDGTELTVAAILKGKDDIYDPLEDTEGYTTNWALCFRDWLLWDRYGPDFRASELGKKTWNRLIRLSDDDQLKGRADTMERFSVNGSFATSIEWSEIIEHFLNQIGGYAVWHSGKLEVVGGFVDGPVLDVDEDDFTGEITTTEAPGKAASVNALRGIFPWEDDKFAERTYHLIDEDELDRDKGKHRWGQYDLPFTKSSLYARKMAKYRVNQETYSMAGSWEATARLLQAPAGSRLRASHDFLGWDQKTLFVTESEIDLSTDGISVRQNFRDTDESEYRFSIVEEESKAGPSTTSTREETQYGQGGARERIQTLHIEKTDLEPNGVEGDRVVREFEAPASGEVRIFALGVWDKTNAQTPDLEARVGIRGGTSIVTTSDKWNNNEWDYEVPDTGGETVQFTLVNVGTTRRIGEAKFMYRIEEA